MRPYEQISQCENQLLVALKNKDIIAIENLLHDNLLFNIPTGQTVTKYIDMQNIRLGIVEISDIIPSEQIIKITGDTATVTVKIKLIGKHANNSIDGNFQYLRVWKLFNGQWKVIAGSGFQVQ